MPVEEKRLRVVGEQTMHCGGCESTVQFALHQVAGIKHVEANHKTQQIEVAYDPEMVDLERVRQEMEWIGYQVEAI